MLPSKKERLREYYRRLRTAARADSFETARRLVDETLVAVEDDFGVPDDPPVGPVPSDRMYPVQDDRVDAVPGRPDVRRLRSFRHDTYIADNGAVRIERRGRMGEEPVVELDKPGKDGRHVGPTG